MPRSPPLWLSASLAAAAAVMAAAGQQYCGPGASCPASKPVASDQIPPQADDISSLLQRSGVHNRVVVDAAGEAKVSNEVEAVLKKKGNKKGNEADAVLKKKGKEKGPPLQKKSKVPLCDDSIVKRTCHSLTGSEGAISITKVQLQDELSTNESFVESLWGALGLATDVNTTQCAALCSAVVEYIKSVGGHLPPYSDMGCYTANGKTFCDVDLDSEELVEEIDDVLNDTFHPDMDVTASDSAGQSHPHLNGTFAASSGAAVPYTLRKAAMCIADLFRMFPSVGDDLAASAESGTGLLAADASQGLGSQSIMVEQLKAQAWISAVLREIRERRTGKFRAKWFGGPGPDSEAEVRYGIYLYMMWLSAEFIEGFRYVDMTQEDPWCAHGLAAYVWGPTERGQCMQDPRFQECHTDATGHRLIYICPVLYKQSQTFRTATLIHEAIHHAGATGQPENYDMESMQHMSQQEQVANAANYENFAQDVAQSVGA